MLTCEITGMRTGPEQYAVIDSRCMEYLPADIITLFSGCPFASFVGRYALRVRIADLKTHPDFVMLGAACDWLRDRGWTVDLSKVAGWSGRLGG